MLSLKQLRNRVNSIKSTQKITKAMHMVSASKLKRFKYLADYSNLYSASLRQIIDDIDVGKHSIDLTSQDRVFFYKIPTTNNKHLLVVITSECGLCGALNVGIINKVKHDMLLLQEEGKEVKLLVVGNKGKEIFGKQYTKFILEHYPNIQNYLADIAYLITNNVIKMISNAEVGECSIYYNHPKNAMHQLVTSKKIIPLTSGGNDSIRNKLSNYEYEGESIMRNIITLYIRDQINSAMLQNQVSEEGARMTAMDNATKNANKLIEQLTIQLNRARQEIITKELTEIISGGEVNTQ